jgi:hypothetical protein
MADPGEIARFHDERHAASGRWEIWMDAAQADAVRDAAG